MRWNAPPGRAAAERGVLTDEEREALRQQRRVEPPTVPGTRRHGAPPVGERGRPPETPDTAEQPER